MTFSKNKIFFLDAYALIYRSHFAFSQNPRISSKGLNTGVMFGFTLTLLEILEKQKPTHIGVIFDTPKPTFRHEMYQEYKANRQETPEDIKIGVPLTKEIIKGFNIPVIELDGYEADDIIGTFAKKAQKEGFEVYMMTPDKDYGQLVDENIFLYKPAFMGNAVDIMGVKEVCEKWDIENVNQVIDMLGMQGDSVDNIPGIPGIGPKTASKFLKEYGSLEALLDNTNNLKGKIKEKVEQFSEQALMSKKLATIDTNVPIPFVSKDMEYNGPNEKILKPIFEELEFKTLLKRVFTTNNTEKKQLTIFNTNTEFEQKTETSPSYQSINTSKYKYILVNSPSKRESLINELNNVDEFSFDTETTGLDAYEAWVVGISFSYKKNEAYYVTMPKHFEDAKKVLHEFKFVLENEKNLIIGQNIKYDALVLKKYGINIKKNIYDTMLASYVINPEGKHNMDALAEQYLNYKTIPITSLIGEKGKSQKNMADLMAEEICDYACEDADITLQLKEKLSTKISELKLENLLSAIEFPLVLVLSEMESNGVSIDKKTLAKISEELANESERIQSEIFELVNQTFNISSPKQLGEILFDKLKLIDNPKKTKTGQYATGEEILSKLASRHEIIRKILQFREYKKLKSTYVDALPKMISPIDHRVHTDYGQAIASTGRLSSNNPNLQNIPIRTEKGKEIRKAFVGKDKNHLILSADYSQIELRVVASLANDATMIAAFQNGVDIHSTTAAKIFDVKINEVNSTMRRKAKEVNFGIIYGISAFGLSQNLNISRSEASEIIKAYFEEFSSIKSYMDLCIQTAKEKGFVQTILGRRRYLADINSKNATMRKYSERNAINAPVQGSAADIIKKAMIDIQQHIWHNKLSTKMIMQVHDELVFEVPLNEVDVMKNIVPDLMKNAISLQVPLEVEVGTGDNWLMAH